MNGINRGAKDTAQRIQPNSVGVELGVWKGDSSEYFSYKTKKLHLVDSWSIDSYKHLDTWERYLDNHKSLVKIKGKVKEKSYKHFQSYYDKVYENVVKRFNDRPHIIIHKMDTVEFFKNLNEKIDWFYVDAAHDEEGCYIDMVNSYNHLKKYGGGFLYGDDYGNKPGVTKAVDKFKIDYDLNYKIKTFGKNQFEIEV